MMVMICLQIRVGFPWGLTFLSKLEFNIGFEIVFYLCIQMFLKYLTVSLLNWVLYSFAEQFDEVIYPEGDVDAVSITKGDVDLLNPETFINDTIIDFYIK